jgi:hypothetical protein
MNKTHEKSSVELLKKLLSFFLLKHLKKSSLDMLLFLNTSNRCTRCFRVKTRIGQVIIQNEKKKKNAKKKKKKEGIFVPPSNQFILALAF